MWTTKENTKGQVIEPGPLGKAWMKAHERVEALQAEFDKACEAGEILDEIADRLGPAMAEEEAALQALLSSTEHDPR